MSDVHDSASCAEAADGLPLPSAAPPDDTSLHMAAEPAQALDPLTRQPEVTLGEVKEVLAEFVRARQHDASGDVAADLRQVYQLLSDQAVALGVDPAQALRRESASAETHRPHLVSAARRILDKG